MAGFVRLENQVRWSSRNWIFDRFLTAVIDQNAADPELSHTLVVARAHQGVFLDLIRKKQGAVADRIIPALLKAANGIVYGGGTGLEDLEAQGRMMYLGELRRLLETLESSK